MTEQNSRKVIWVTEEELNKMGACPVPWKVLVVSGVAGLAFARLVFWMFS